MIIYDIKIKKVWEACTMDNKRTRFKKMEMIMTCVLCLDAVLFLAYLIFAGTLPKEYIWARE